jgi:hypothetical protein
VIEANGVAPCYIRPIALRGYGEIGVSPKGSPIEVYIANFPWGKYIAGSGGADVCVSSWNRLAPNTMPALAKAGANYMNSQLIRMEAEINGYQEGIALDVNGLVSEGSGENIFVVRNGVIYTPPLANSALSGITRDSVLTLARHLGLSVVEQAFPRELLYIADEVFFSGTAAEVSAHPHHRPHPGRRRQGGRNHQENRRRVLRHRQRPQARPLRLAHPGQSRRRGVRPRLSAVPLPLQKGAIQNSPCPIHSRSLRMGGKPRIHIRHIGEPAGPLDRSTFLRKSKSKPCRGDPLPHEIVSTPRRVQGLSF